MFKSHLLLQKTLKLAGISIPLEIFDVFKLAFEHIMDFKFYYLTLFALLFISIVKCKDSSSYATGPHLQVDFRSPSLISPEIDSKQAATVLFKWEKVEKAESYNLNLSKSKSFKTVFLDSVANLTTVRIKKLAQNSTIYWRVRAIFGDIKGKWSGVQSFTTIDSTRKLLPAPEQVAPSAKEKDVALKPRFKWKAVDGADGYELDASTKDKMIIHQQVDSAGYILNKPLSDEETYYWRVRATNGGKKGKWSEIHSFTTMVKQLSAPEQMVPLDREKDVALKPEFKWKPVDGANGYQLDVSQGNQMVLHQRIDKANFTPSKALSYRKTYYWRVRAIKGGIRGKWSEIHSFITTESNEDNHNANSDRQALMDLYKSTGGKQWTHNQGWGDGDPSNSWYGIKVNNQGRVISIDLFKNNLRGRLPISIGNLDKVTYLNVKNNHLSGAIPPEIGNMTSLETLILQGRTYDIGGTLKEPPKKLKYAYHPGKHLSNTNNFEGKIPSTIGNLSNLRFLEISNAPNIIGPIPSELGKLSNLEGLYLNFCNLAGTTLPSSLGNLTKLKHLYIADAQLEGEIPASFKNLTQLTHLNFGGGSHGNPTNHLTGKIPDFSNLTELRGLVLPKNNLSGKYPTYFNNGNFTKLNTLNLAWNNLTGPLPDFTNLPNLESLTASGNNLTGSLDVLLNLPAKIQIIGLGWNNFTGELPQSGWPDFYQLKTLFLNNNKLSGAIPCDFWKKVDNPRLGICYLGHNKFTANCTRAMKKVKGNTTGGTAKLDIKVSGNNF